MDIETSEAVELLKQSREAVLATLEEPGPFTSAVNCFWQDGGTFGRLVFLMSDLARHAKNTAKDSRVSLHIMETSLQPLYQRKRVSAQAKVVQVRDVPIFQQYKQKYLELFPQAAIFFTLADFRFYEADIYELYYIGGFGRAKSLREG